MNLIITGYVFDAQHLLTDGGKDFRSNHLNQILVQLGFVRHLRDRPSEGGIIERPLGTYDTEFFQLEALAKTRE